MIERFSEEDDRRTTALLIFCSFHAFVRNRNTKSRGRLLVNDVPMLIKTRRERLGSAQRCHHLG